MSLIINTMYTYKLLLNNITYIVFMIEAALFAIQELFEKEYQAVPIFVSGTIVDRYLFLTPQLKKGYLQPPRLHDILVCCRKTKESI